LNEIESKREEDTTKANCITYILSSVI